MKFFLAVCFAFFIAAVTCKHPNVIVLIADDLGYGDLGCFGNDSVRTPHLDRLASEGAMLTQAYAAAPLCTPSRAALMTGRYAIRSGMDSSNDHYRVLFSLAQSGGLPISETTIVKAMRNAGYMTKMVGKWHLGSQPPHTPIAHGFHSFYGLPLTNVDSCGEGPTRNIFELLYSRSPSLWHKMLLTVAVLFLARLISWRTGAALLCFIGAAFLLGVLYMTSLALSDKSHCVLWRDEEVIEQPLKLQNLTVKFTNEAVRFIRENKDQPFFLHYPYVKVHTRLFTSPAFTGVSKAGEIGDNIEEMDWSVGRILQELDEQGLADNTFVFFTSDNGGWLEAGIHGSRNGILKGGKAQNWEGGIRVPTIIRWPGHIPPGQNITAVTSLMDLLPTLVAITGQDSEKYPGLDGTNILPLLTGASDEPPHPTLFHYCGDRIAAMRFHQYKLHFETPVWEKGQECPNAVICSCHGEIHDPPLVYDMEADPTESTPLDTSSLTDMLEAAKEVLLEHVLTMEPVPNQLAAMPLPWLKPRTCCNWPRCKCEDPETVQVPI